MIRKSKKSLMTLILAGAMALSWGSSASAKEIKSEPSTYQSVVEVQDWGATVTKVIVSLGKPVARGSVANDTFKVEVKRYDNRTGEKVYINEGTREVTNAYVSDEEGNPVQRGKFATLEMKIAPNDSLGAALNYGSGGNVWAECDYTITQLKGISFGSGNLQGIVADTCVKERRIGIDDFSLNEGTYDGIEMSYADFTPEKDKVKNPLIIWLHGGGEGGRDATIPLAGNKAVNYASDEIQSIFGGAYVLAPQAPTMWMHTESGKLDGTSIYTDALIELIKEYVSSNEDIDTNRIYVGGCSNGGYMTEVLLNREPEYFAAAFPICGAPQIGSYDNDKFLEILAKTPTWWTGVYTDGASVNIPTRYDQLIEINADVVMTMYDSVIDTSGLYKNEDGSAHLYPAHWSWIYVHNNEAKAEVNGFETTIMEWLASKSLNK